MSKKNFTNAVFKVRLTSEMERGEFTQATIAKRLALSEGTVSAWMKSGAVPQRRTAVALAEMLGVRVEWLLKGQDPKLPAARGEQAFSNLPVEGANALPRSLRTTEEKAAAEATNPLADALRSAGESLLRAAKVIERGNI